MLSIRPHKTKELIDKLPYAEHTIYKALKRLADGRLIEKRRQNRDVVVEISADYATQKLREVHIKALTYGIDPEMLMRDSTLAVWKKLVVPRTLKELQRKTGYSYPWVNSVVRFLTSSNLAVYNKRKPVVAVLNEEHVLNALLRQYLSRKRKPRTIYYAGTLPFERLIRTPAEIERLLYERVDSGLTIKNTGFVIRGEGKLTLVESVEEEMGPEELFLHDIGTVEGVEDFCIRLVASGELDYTKLFDLAKEKDMVNVIGCYLDILNDIKGMVNPEAIKEFQRNVSKRKVVFLKEERRYGKGGWEHKYERKWNVDLYLDLGAIRHGARSA